MGRGGYPPELAWWTGGRPRALVAGEGWGGRRGDAVAKKGRVGAWLAVPKRSWRSGGVQGLRLRGGRW